MIKIFGGSSNRNLLVTTIERYYKIERSGCPEPLQGAEDAEGALLRASLRRRTGRGRGVKAMRRSRGRAGGERR